MSEICRRTRSITNPYATTVLFVLEPWGEVFEMPALATFEMLAEGPHDVAIEVEFTAEAITAYANFGDTAQLFHEGVELGGDRPSFPNGPEGLSMREFVGFMNKHVPPPGR